VIYLNKQVFFLHACYFSLFALVACLFHISVTSAYFAHFVADCISAHVVWYLCVYLQLLLRPKYVSSIHTHARLFTCHSCCALESQHRRDHCLACTCRVTARRWRQRARQRTSLWALFRSEQQCSRGLKKRRDVGMAITNLQCIDIYDHWQCVCNVCVACREDQYQCQNTGRCISASRVCNGHNSCGDWSDERNCSKWYPCLLNNRFEQHMEAGNFIII